jgi:hypothetical protein
MSPTEASSGLTIGRGFLLPFTAQTPKTRKAAEPQSRKAAKPQKQD